MITVTPTDIPDIRLVSTRWFTDGRGEFSEVYSRSRWQEAGIVEDWVQDNHAVSVRSGTVRGLHFQRPPMAQAKLIRVVRGAIWDVAVDIRVGSPWFGQWVGVTLSAADRRQLYVPAGFAHGYCTLEPDTEVLYKVDSPYAAETEGGIAWDDPDLALPWPLPASGPVLADKDRLLPHLVRMEAC
ncbi:MAG: dTDP-4-dehydrorhamnose 3,5-epimerase, partial [Rhodospirillaceae bacterium]|nr:dTDP-4-dehydrorhamnose 3,5-epimerase [Rhodospirillaceae bacterium]